MSFSERLELVCGITTGLLWLVFSLNIGGIAGPPDLSVENFVGGFIIYGVPGMFVAAGAYAHVVGGNPWGRVLLTVGCSLLVLVFLLSLCGGIARWGKWIVFITFVPSGTGVITLLAARANDRDAE